jgi:hypothetical protein
VVVRSSINPTDFASSIRLRTATPLIGAGLDRIAHFRYIGGINPIEMPLVRVSHWQG